MPMPMPVKAVKSGWANGPKMQRTDEEADRPAEAAGLPVVTHVRRGQVEDVLGEGEADADHPGVHQPVEDAVELGASEDQQQQDEQPLGGLLGHRRDHGRGERVGVLEDHAVEELQDQRAQRSRRTHPSPRPSASSERGSGS